MQSQIDELGAEKARVSGEGTNALAAARRATEHALIDLGSLHLDRDRVQSEFESLQRRHREVGAHADRTVAELAALRSQHATTLAELANVRASHDSSIADARDRRRLAPHDAKPTRRASGQG